MSETRLQFADLEPVGPDTPAGRYLRCYWQPVMRGRDLRPRHAKPIEILGEQFTAYRGETGAPHIIAFGCPHRGAQLSLGWVEGDDLRCRYHGWKYDATGQCIEQPTEDRPFCARVKAPSYPTREYAGLIFGYFGAGAPPPFRQYPALDRPGVIVADPPELLPCSFWNRLDNDTGHVPWVHRGTARARNMKNYLVIRRESVEEAPYGMKLIRHPGDGEDDQSLGLRGIANFFMPNTFQFWQRTRAKGYEGQEIWDTKFTWTVPVNDRKYVGFDVTHTPLEGDAGKAYAAARLKHQEAEAVTRWDLAEKILAGDMTIEELPDDLGTATRFEIEDYVIQVGQGTIARRNKEHLGQV
ncbi:MAG TPA: Rieske 2Fe-2S domain-containing protein, partial [Stellaceae bacterium]|nr:Rieske 2Fe-2S domain-containing protein [Stellaceae bacterium]